MGYSSLFLNQHHRRLFRRAYSLKEAPDLRVVRNWNSRLPHHQSAREQKLPILDDVARRVAPERRVQLDRVGQLINLESSREPDPLLLKNGRDGNNLNLLRIQIQLVALDDLVFIQDLFRRQ